MPKKSQTITILKHGQRVSITPNFKERNGVTYKSYLIRATILGERRTMTASSMDEARKAAGEMISQVKATGGVVATYKPKDVAIIEAALETCSKAKVIISTATREYADAIKHLPAGVGLVEAVKGYVSMKSREQNKPIKVSELVKIYLEALEGRTPTHVYAVSIRLNRAAAYFNCNIGDVTSSDVDAWLKSLKVSPLTRNHHRTTLISLFRYAQRKDYLPVGMSAAEKSERFKEKAKDKKIACYTPKEAEHLINRIDPKWIAYVAIGLFAGIRPQEIFNLTWDDIKDDHIEVRAGNSKVRIRRIVPLLPNLAAWLETCPNRSGDIAPVYAGGDPSRAQFLSKAMRSAAEEGGFKVIFDGLRHSFITYRVAEIQNLPQVALEAGNSPEIIQEHYNGRSTPAEAKKYFGITPLKRSGKIINFAS
jgi:integrase